MKVLDAETARAIDEFLLMLARCKTQEEKRQLVFKLAEGLVQKAKQRTKV